MFTSNLDYSTESTYTLYRRGMELLADNSFGEAADALEEAARREPHKASVREALGRAYFHSERFVEAATEFEAVVENNPTDDYAHHCLGRALTKTGDRTRAQRHLAIAASLRPDRRDYRLHRDRLKD
jgi:Flp pilus assembly protein TadD